MLFNKLGWIVSPASGLTADISQEQQALQCDPWGSQNLARVTIDWKTSFQEKSEIHMKTMCSPYEINIHSMCLI